MTGQHGLETSFSLTDWALCKGGPQWECQLSRFGDRFLYCQKYCGYGKGLIWKKKVYDQCKYKMMKFVDGDYDPINRPARMLEDSYIKNPKYHDEPYYGSYKDKWEEPWHNWERRDKIHPYRVRKICCSHRRGAIGPARKKEECFDIDGVNVAVRGIPARCLEAAALEPLAPRREEEQANAQTRRRALADFL